MDQGKDRRDGDRRSGRDRRSGDRRAAGDHAVGSPTALRGPCCPVCGDDAPAIGAVTIPGAGGDLLLHVECGVRLSQAVLDRLQHATLDVSSQPSSEEPDLSPRELQVLQGLVQGERDREIARRLGIAEHTVRNYAYELRRTLGVRTRSQAAVRAIQLGLVPATRT
ncbi:MAG: response regulator transcription factor [Chloroflexi bacterium]|nr:response regulator transcription factor [Chloroflexota bacterium]